MDALTKFRTKTGAATLTASMLLASVLGIAAVAAQAGPGDNCTGDRVVSFGDSFFGLEDLGNRLLSTSPTSRQYSLASPMLAGDYTIDAVSYDGYVGRETISPQPAEQWYAEFLAADGTVLATTGTTNDIEDEVEEATWRGLLGDVSLAQDATDVRVVHAAPGTPSVNSVRPVCIGATGGPDTEPPVTEPDPSSVTLDYDSTTRTTSSAALTCGDQREAATGNTIDLTINGVEAGSSCTAVYSDFYECGVLVDPIQFAGVGTAGNQIVNIPADGGANVVVDIDCADRPEILSPTTTAAPVVTTPPTTAPAVATTIAPQVKAQAEAATAQTGNPAFTG